MRTRLNSLVFASAISLTGGAAPAFAAPAHAVPAQTVAVEQQQAAVPAEPEQRDQDEARYAEREKQSEKAKEFSGGNTVLVISGSTVLVALLVLLLIL
ncbi:MAG: hypothetical protein AB7O24_33090 [Kofleriaceae bacterium]